MNTTSACERNHRIRSIKAFSLTTYVLCSPETLQSLQIFPTELHSKNKPWGTKGTAQSKMQSVSLSNLFQNFTHTPQGGLRLRSFLCNPLSSIGVIEGRQQAITLLLDHQRTGVRHEMIKTLKKVRNAKMCVDLLRKGVDRCSMAENFCGSVWSNIRGFVIHALKLRDQIDAFMNKPTGFLHNVCYYHHHLNIPSASPDRTDFVQAASRIHRQSLTSIGEILQRTVDFDQAEYNIRPTIMVGIDPQLDKMRRDYDALGLFLEKIALSITQQVPEWAARRIKSCIFLPHVGFLIAVELNPDIEMSSFLSIKDNGDIWDEFFVADGAVHYKNNQMRHLDAQFGDIYRNIAGMDSPLF